MALIPKLTKDEAIALCLKHKLTVTGPGLIWAGRRYHFATKPATRWEYDYNGLMRWILSHQQHIPKHFKTIAEASTQLSICKTTIYSWISSEFLKDVKQIGPGLGVTYVNTDEVAKVQQALGRSSNTIAE